MSGRPIGIAELHLHLEGSLFPASAVELADAEHPWSTETPASLRRKFRYASFDEFLEAIRRMCSILCSVAVLERIARELSSFLGQHGVRYAEVYVSPYIYMRAGITYREVIEAVSSGFRQAGRKGGARCVILLDSVRHWGREAAERVLEGAGGFPHSDVVGFGLGGSETPPLEEFVEIFDRARELGLRTVVHAGETGHGDDVRKAVELLCVERVAHGIRAIDSPEALDLITDRRIPLDVAITSNYRTRVVTATPHPIRALLDRGVVVTLSTDDPSLFRTDPVREYQRARRFGRLTADELYAVAANGVAASFATQSVKEAMIQELAERRARDEEAR